MEFGIKTNASFLKISFPFSHSATLLRTFLPVMYVSIYTVSSNILKFFLNTKVSSI